MFNGQNASAWYGQAPLSEEPLRPRPTLRPGERPSSARLLCGPNVHILGTSGPAQRNWASPRTRRREPPLRRPNSAPLRRNKPRPQTALAANSRRDRLLASRRLTDPETYHKHSQLRALCVSGRGPAFDNSLPPGFDTWFCPVDATIWKRLPGNRLLALAEAGSSPAYDVPDPSLAKNAGTIRYFPFGSVIHSPLSQRQNRGISYWHVSLPPPPRGASTHVAVPVVGVVTAAADGTSGESIPSDEAARQRRLLDAAISGRLEELQELWRDFTVVASARPDEENEVGKPRRWVLEPNGGEGDGFSVSNLQYIRNSVLLCERFMHVVCDPDLVWRLRNVDGRSRWEECTAPFLYAWAPYHRPMAAGAAASSTAQRPHSVVLLRPGWAARATSCRCAWAR